MMKRMWVLTVALAAAAVAGGCATGGAGAGYDALTSAQPAAAELAMVHVQNNNWSDIDVFAVRDGQAFRLGMVTSMTSAMLRLPSQVLVGSPRVQLYIHPIGSNGGFTSDGMLVSAGQTVDLRIENNINLTSYSVW